MDGRGLLKKQWDCLFSVVHMLNHAPWLRIELLIMFNHSKHASYWTRVKSTRSYDGIVARGVLTCLGKFAIIC